MFEMATIECYLFFLLFFLCSSGRDLIPKHFISLSIHILVSEVSLRRTIHRVSSKVMLRLSSFYQNLISCSAHVATLLISSAPIVRNGAIVALDAKRRTGTVIKPSVILSWSPLFKYVNLELRVKNRMAKYPQLLIFNRRDFPPLYPRVSIYHAYSRSVYYQYLSVLSDFYAYFCFVCNGVFENFEIIFGS